MAQRSAGRPTRHTFGWARVTPWRGRSDVAHVVLAEGAPPERPGVDDCLERLKLAGYSTAVTSALTAGDALPFVDAGFEVRERLHLLEHRLDRVERSRPSEPALRRAWRADRAGVLDLDRLAFDDFWRLDDAALHDALRATPAARFRVGDCGSADRRRRSQSAALATDGGGDRRGGASTAYAITGRAGPRGYLQRIAVHPDARRCGWGRTLVLDALRWLGRHDVRRAIVNTQWENTGALALYESCGFRELPVGLCVLDRPL